jgi:hypothetical protein
MLNSNPITILKSYPHLDLIELRIYELVTRLGNCFSGTKNGILGSSMSINVPLKYKKSPRENHNHCIIYSCQNQRQ